MKEIVLNTSSSIFLIRMGLMSYLLNHFKLITSEEIANEIKEGVEIGYRDAKILSQYLDEEKIKVIKVKETERIVKEFNIKKTDASIISLAQKLDCLLATEDRQIERISLLNGVKITNTCLLIYFLWINDEITDLQIHLLLDLLIRNGYNKEICLKIKEKVIGGKKNG